MNKQKPKRQVTTDGPHLAITDNHGPKARFSWASEGLKLRS